MLVALATIDDGDDCVPTRLGAAGSVGGEEDGLVKGDVSDDHAFPVEPPLGPLPLGHNEKGSRFVPVDLFQDTVELGPGRVDVGFDEVPAVGERVATESIGVVGIRCEVAWELVMLRGSEDISLGVKVEVDADVVKDNEIEHDIFVSATGVGDEGNGKSDALGERRSGASAEGRLELRLAGVVVGGDHVVAEGWWTGTRTGGVGGTLFRQS